MVHAHRVAPGKKVRLRDYNPAETGGLMKSEGEEQLRRLGAKLTELQEMHYAAGHSGVLIVLQALDTGGKDGTINHVMTYFNPAACWVKSFGVPTAYELSHDFLWRCHRATPPRGMISVFNRSYYEDVLVVRVHELEPRKVWQRRYEHINNFEALLADSGTTIIKFFLHISKEEQRDRLLAREGDPEKQWKLSTSDWPEHELYDRYVEAYEDALSRCSTAHAPWYIVPSDHKWYRNLAVAQTLVDLLEPYRRSWRRELEQRGRMQLAAIAAQQERQRVPAPLPDGSP
jgi:PPK2 family polyphosphate:nucleotide phosphotransferase